MKSNITYNIFYLLAFFCGTNLSFAQLTTSTAKTPQQLVEDILLGTGVQVSNISYTGSGLARGEFNGVNSNIGFDGGVLLSSGRISDAIGPNDQSNESTSFGRAGDSDLDGLIAPIRTADAAVLEFDFKVPADTIFFDYIFASEEYPEFAPPNSSAYSDAFGFLLTGPNPSGGNYTNRNLAVLPGTSTTVEINNVNAVTNNTYYISNGTGSSPPQNTDATVVQYDAFTVPLTAIAAVVPCATYHIKLVVADGWRSFPDRVYDSGVFLKENSFGANVKNPNIDFLSTAPGCDGDSIDFINTGTSTPGILYSWDFGVGATPANSSLENPTDVVYSSPGLKLVTYSMNINCGDTTLYLSKGITIDETPIPSFSSNAPQCELQSVNFTYSGTSGQNWTYIWDFGSGASPSTSTAQNPLGVTYNTPGTKTVTLTVKNGNCSETITQSIVINDRPIASFSNTGPAGIGYGIDFTNTGSSGAGVSYQWNFGSGATPGTANSENLTGVTYSSSGTKTITLIVTSSGCKDTTSGTLDILTTPNPSFSSNAPQPVGFPVLFSYTGNTGSNFTYSWDFGSGALPPTSTSATPPAVYYSTPGTKTITLTVTNGSITITITQTIDIDQPPLAAFSTSAPNCEGVGIDFINNGTSGATYDWDFGAGANPLTANTRDQLGVVYSTPGFKTVQLVTTLNGNKDTSEATIYIIPQPKPVFGHNAPQCEGADIDFTYSGNTGTGWVFTWDFGVASTPNISSSTSPQGILYGSPGNKIVALTVSNAMCAATDTQIISINPTPTSGIFANASSCSGDSVSFANTGSSGLTYSWNLGSGANPVASTDENPKVVYSTKGIKIIQQVVSQGGCSDTSNTTINVLETPDASIIVSPNVCLNYPYNPNFFVYTGTTSNGWTYLWDFGEGANPASSTMLNPLSFGMYWSTTGNKTIQITVSNQFCSDSATQQVRVDTTPSVSFTINDPVCELDTIYMESVTLNPSYPNLTYNWGAQGGAGSGIVFLDQMNGKAVYNTDGMKTISLSVNIGNCGNQAVQYVNINDKPEVNITSTAPLCQGEDVAFYNLGSTESKWKYNWDFGSAANPSIATSQNVVGIKFSNAGKHKITLKTSDQNCFNTDTMSIEIYELPNVYAGTDTIICADDCIQLGKTTELGHSYNWFPASMLDDPNISNPVVCPSAEFTQLVLSESIDLTSCLATDTVYVTMLSSARVNAGDDVEMCFGDSVQIGAAVIKGQTYQWTPTDGLSSATASSPMASPDTTIKYSVEASYKNCEPINDIVWVTVHKANADAGEDVKIARGEEVTLNASGGVSYNWNPPDYLSNAFIPNPISKPNESIDYVVMVTDVFNCTDEDSVSIIVVNPDIFIPNSFTPTQTGRNDIFRVRGSFMTDFKMTVFNRAGSVVYFSKDFYSGWDGNNQQSGAVMPKGAYVYQVTGQDESGEEVNISGVVNLIR